MTTPPLIRRSPDAAIPLAAVQERFLSYMVGHDLMSLRMCAAALRILGSLNTDLLGKSLEAVVRRHESLRTRFVRTDGILLQQTDDTPDHRFEVVDVDRHSSIDQERAVMQLAQQFVDSKIHLSTGPLFEARLFRLSDSEHVLILLADHLIADAGSCAILTRDLWSLYQQGMRGMPLSLPDLPIQFADYAVWQHRTYPAWLEQHESFWRGRLERAPRTVLTPDAELAPVDHPVGATLHFPFGKRLTLSLQELARRERTLLALVVLAVYAITMSRWCKQHDLVIEFVSHGRYGRPELENMVGFLANSLYLRIETKDDDAFLDVLKRVSREFHAAYEHQDYGQLIYFLPQCATDLSFNWIPNTWGRKSSGSPQEPELGLKLLPFPVTFIWPVKFSPYFSDTPAGIVMTVNYRPDLFAAASIERFGRNLRACAEEFVTQPLDCATPRSAAQAS